MNETNPLLIPVKFPSLSILLLSVEFALMKSYGLKTPSHQTEVFWECLSKSLTGIAKGLPILQGFPLGDTNNLAEVLTWALGRHSEEEILNYGRNFITRLCFSH